MIIFLVGLKRQPPHGLGKVSSSIRSDDNDEVLDDIPLLLQGTREKVEQVIPSPGVVIRVRNTGESDEHESINQCKSSDAKESVGSEDEYGDDFSDFGETNAELCNNGEQNIHQSADKEFDEHLSENSDDNVQNDQESPSFDDSFDLREQQRKADAKNYLAKSRSKYEERLRQQKHETEAKKREIMSRLDKLKQKSKIAVNCAKKSVHAEGQKSRRGPALQRRIKEAHRSTSNWVGHPCPIVDMNASDSILLNDGLNEEKYEPAETKLTPERGEFNVVNTNVLHDFLDVALLPQNAIEHVHDITEENKTPDCVGMRKELEEALGPVVMGDGGMNVRNVHSMSQHPTNMSAEHPLLDDVYLDDKKNPHHAANKAQKLRSTPAQRRRDTATPSKRQVPIAHYRRGTASSESRSKNRRPGESESSKNQPKIRPRSGALGQTKPRNTRTSRRRSKVRTHPSCGPIDSNILDLLHDSGDEDTSLDGMSQQQEPAVVTTFDNNDMGLSLSHSIHVVPGNDEKDVFNVHTDTPLLQPPPSVWSEIDRMQKLLQAMTHDLNEKRRAQNSSAGGDSVPRSQAENYEIEDDVEMINALRSSLASKLHLAEESNSSEHEINKGDLTEDDCSDASCERAPPPPPFEHNDHIAVRDPSDSYHKVLDPPSYNDEVDNHRCIQYAGENSTPSGDILLDMQLHLLRDKNDILNKYGAEPTGSSSGDIVQTPDRNLDELVWGDSTYKLRQVEGVDVLVKGRRHDDIMASELVEESSTDPSVDSSLSQGEDEHGIVALFAREIFQQKQQEETDQNLQQLMQRKIDFAETLAVRYQEHAVVQSPPPAPQPLSPLEVDDMDRSISPRTYWDTLIAKSPLPPTVSSISTVEGRPQENHVTGDIDMQFNENCTSGEDVVTSDVETERLDLPQSDKMKSNLHTKTPERDMNIDRRLTGAELRLLMTEELHKQEEIYRCSLQLAEAQQEHTLQAATSAMRDIVTDAQAGAAELANRAQLMQMQHAYELSLASTRMESQLAAQRELSNREATAKIKQLEDCIKAQAVRFEELEALRQTVDNVGFAAHLMELTSSRPVHVDQINTENEILSHSHSEEGDNYTASFEMESRVHFPDDLLQKSGSDGYNEEETGNKVTGSESGPPSHFSAKKYGEDNDMSIEEVLSTDSDRLISKSLPPTKGNQHSVCDYSDMEEDSYATEFYDESFSHSVATSKVLSHQQAPFLTDSTHETSIKEEEYEDSNEIFDDSITQVVTSTQTASHVIPSPTRVSASQLDCTGEFVEDSCITEYMDDTFVQSEASLRVSHQNIPANSYSSGYNEETFVQLSISKPEDENPESAVKRNDSTKLLSHKLTGGVDVQNYLEDLDKRRQGGNKAIDLRLELEKQKKDNQLVLLKKQNLPPDAHVYAQKALESKYAEVCAQLESERWALSAACFKERRAFEELQTELMALAEGCHGNTPVVNITDSVAISVVEDGAQGSGQTGAFSQFSTDILKNNSIDGAGDESDYSSEIFESLSYHHNESSGIPPSNSKSVMPTVLPSEDELSRREEALRARRLHAEKLLAAKQEELERVKTLARLEAEEREIAKLFQIVDSFDVTQELNKHRASIEASAKKDVESAASTHPAQRNQSGSGASGNNFIKRPPQGSSDIPSVSTVLLDGAVENTQCGGGDNPTASPQSSVVSEVYEDESWDDEASVDEELVVDENEPRDDAGSVELDISVPYEKNLESGDEVSEEEVHFNDEKFESYVSDEKFESYVSDEAGSVENEYNYSNTFLEEETQLEKLFDNEGEKNIDDVHPSSKSVNSGKRENGCVVDVDGTQGTPQGQGENRNASTGFLEESAGCGGVSSDTFLELDESLDQRRTRILILQDKIADIKRGRKLEKLQAKQAERERLMAQEEALVKYLAEEESRYLAEKEKVQHARLQEKHEADVDNLIQILHSPVSSPDIDGEREEKDALADDSFCSSQSSKYDDPVLSAEVGRRVRCLESAVTIQRYVRGFLGRTIAQATLRAETDHDGKAASLHMAGDVLEELHTTQVTEDMALDDSFTSSINSENSHGDTHDHSCDQRQWSTVKNAEIEEMELTLKQMEITAKIREQNAADLQHSKDSETSVKSDNVFAEDEINLSTNITFAENVISSDNACDDLLVDHNGVRYSGSGNEIDDLENKKANYEETVANDHVSVEISGGNGVQDSLQSGDTINKSDYIRSGDDFSSVVNATADNVARQENDEGEKSSPLFSATAHEIDEIQESHMDIVGDVSSSYDVTEHSHQVVNTVEDQTTDLSIESDFSHDSSKRDVIDFDDDDGYDDEFEIEEESQSTSDKNVDDTQNQHVIEQKILDGSLTATSLDNVNVEESFEVVEAAEKQRVDLSDNDAIRRADDLQLPHPDRDSREANEGKEFYEEGTFQKDLDRDSDSLDSGSISIAEEIEFHSISSDENMMVKIQEGAEGYDLGGPRVRDESEISKSDECTEIEVNDNERGDASVNESSLRQGSVEETTLFEESVEVVGGISNDTMQDEDYDLVQQVENSETTTKPVQPIPSLDIPVVDHTPRKEEDEVLVTAITDALWKRLISAGDVAGILQSSHESATLGKDFVWESGEDNSEGQSVVDSGLENDNSALTQSTNKEVGEKSFIDRRRHPLDDSGEEEKTAEYTQVEELREGDKTETGPFDLSQDLPTSLLGDMPAFPAVTHNREKVTDDSQQSLYDLLGDDEDNDISYERSRLGLPAKRRSADSFVTDESDEITSDLDNLPYVQSLWVKKSETYLQELLDYIGKPQRGDLEISGGNIWDDVIACLDDKNIDASVCFRFL